MNIHTRRNPRKLIEIMAVGALALAVGCAPEKPPGLSNAACVNVLPRIIPDYSSLTVPPNSAPLNFTIKEPGNYYVTEIRGQRAGNFIVKSNRPEVEIPIKKWRSMLEQNRGSSIGIDIYAQAREGGWTKFQTIRDTIACEPIDQYLVYRLMPPLYTFYGEMGIYQRDLSSFVEKPLWLNRMSEKNCMNCHTFKNNDPDFMIAHMRGGPGNGTLIIKGEHIMKVNTATDFNSAVGFPAWHPDGKIIAFSANMVRQFFHAVGDNREGFDKAGKIVVYNTETNILTSSPEVSDPTWMSTQPEWSRDGRYLYFCRAPQFPSDSISTYHTKIMYDLVRIGYDVKRDLWGKIEMVVSHEKTGQSVSFPRISPDGRFLLCCMMPFGTFPVFRPGGDLYLLNLKTLELNKLPVNSEAPESFHSWSSNSRWFVFSSKRMDGISMRPFFTHVDTQGNATKPFVLPQKDPHFYESLLKTYNLPELITKPVRISPPRLVRAFCDNNHSLKAVLDPKVKMHLDSLKKSSPSNKKDADMWQQLKKGGTSH